MALINVALQGFEPRAADRFRNLFLINYRGKCVVADQAEADVTLIDLEGLGAESETLLATQDVARTVILSESGRGPAGYRVLQKPARLNLLWQAIVSAHSGEAAEAVPVELPTAPAPAAGLSDKRGQDVSAGRPSAAQLRKLGAETTYDPADYFVGALQEALAGQGSHRAVQLTTWNLRRVVVHPATDSFYSDLSHNQFRALTATPLAKNLQDQIRVEYLPGLPTREELDGMQRSSCAYMLWEMAYSTSRGRLSKHVVPADQQTLSRWPNFTRLPSMPNGMRIAAVWAGQPQRLDDIAARLDIPAEEVYAFYAGASALGLAASVGQQDEVVAEKRNDKPAISRNLLGSLLGHLGSALRPRGAAAKQGWVVGEQA